MRRAAPRAEAAEREIRARGEAQEVAVGGKIGESAVAGLCRRCGITGAQQRRRACERFLPGHGSG